MGSGVSSNKDAAQTAPDESSGNPVTKQQLETLLAGLPPACSQDCPCHQLTAHLAAASSWDAAQPGYSRVHTDLAQLAAVLLAGRHSRTARQAVLMLYNWLVVSPLCVKLSSPDAAVAAAARAEALTAVLAATKSGLVQQLRGDATRSSFCYATMGSHLAALAPIEAELKQSFADCLSDTQIICCWVTALARIWPGSMLAAPGGGGGLAADVLELCERHLSCLGWVQQHNQTLAACQQQQQSKQPGLMKLPADDVTAAVVHTASLLLPDLGRHMQQSQQFKTPEAVRKSLSGCGPLLHVAVPLAALYGNQLRLHLLHELQQEQRQQQQAVLTQRQQQQQQQAVPTQRQDTTDSSWSSRSAAERAEGVLLCRADMLQSEQLQQLPGDPALVHSWRQHFEIIWCERWPPHLLLTVPSAIAAAADASGSKDALDRQGYAYLLPEQCCVDTATAAADAASSSSSRACCDVVTCLEVVQAAVEVLQGYVGTDAEATRLCERSPALAKSPPLLLCCALAALRLAPGQQALVTATRCFYLAVKLSASVFAGLLAGRSGTVTQAPAAVSAEIWSTLGLATLVARQVVCVVDAAAASSGNCSSSAGRTASGTAADGSMSARFWSDHVAALAAAATGVGQLFGCAIHFRGSSAVVTESDQLQQASFTVQVMEAVLRCHARLLAEPSGVAAAPAAKFYEVRWQMCGSVVTRACHLVKGGSSSVPGFEAQQVLQACMSALLAVVSTPMGGAGAPLIFILSECAQLFARMQLARALVDEVDAQLAASGACLFVIGRCLLGMAEQLQLCVSDPGGHSFSDWVLESCASPHAQEIAGMPESSRLRVAVAQLADALQMVAQGVETSGRFAVHGMLSRCKKLGWCAPTAAPASVKVQEALSCVCAALSGALRSGQPAQCRAARELLVRCHWVNHALAASWVLSDVWDQHAPVLVMYAQQQQQQQQRRRRRRRLGPAARDALVGLASGLRAAGGALCAAAPNPFSCNNPACRSTAGASAGFALVRGEGVVCGGCLGLARGAAVPEGWVAAARYCSVACQQQHWACHKACLHDSVLGDAEELQSRVLQAAADVVDPSTVDSFCACCSVGKELGEKQ